jgi:hypothetical protein
VEVGGLYKYTLHQSSRALSLGNAKHPSSKYGPESCHCLLALEEFLGMQETLSCQRVSQKQRRGRTEKPPLTAA